MVTLQGGGCVAFYLFCDCRNFGRAHLVLLILDYLIRCGRHSGGWAAIAVAPLLAFTSCLGLTRAFLTVRHSFRLVRSSGQLYSFLSHIPYIQTPAHVPLCKSRRIAWLRIFAGAVLLHSYVLPHRDRPERRPVLEKRSL